MSSWEADKFLQKNYPLSEISTLRVGGPAEYLAKVENKEYLPPLVRWAKDRGLPIWILGGASNAVISDRGLPGLTLVLSNSSIKLEPLSKQRALIKSDGGVAWDDLVRFSVENGIWGLENLSGIPGTTGAAPIQNIGAYGTEISEHFISAELFDLESAEFFQWTAREFQFGYRTSSLKQFSTPPFLVWSVVLELSREPTPPPEHGEFLDKLSEKLSLGLQDSPQLRREVVLSIRSAKGMLVGSPNYLPSVGSFFVNPVVSEREFEKLLLAVERVARDSQELPRYPTEKSGYWKIPAARLIELAGFERGYRRGNVGLSPKHALSIVNFGGASAEEIVAFAEEIRWRVFSLFGVRLRPEPVFLGEFDNTELFSEL